MQNNLSKQKDEETFKEDFKTIDVIQLFFYLNVIKL